MGQYGSRPWYRTSSTIQSVPAEPVQPYAPPASAPEPAQNDLTSTLTQLYGLYTKWPRIKKAIEKRDVGEIMQLAQEEMKPNAFGRRRRRRSRKAGKAGKAGKAKAKAKVKSRPKHRRSLKRKI